MPNKLIITVDIERMDAPYMSIKRIIQHSKVFNGSYLPPSAIRAPFPLEPPWLRELSSSKKLSWTKIA